MQIDHIVVVYYVFFSIKDIAELKTDGDGLGSEIHITLDESSEHTEKDRADSDNGSNSSRKYSDSSSGFIPQAPIDVTTSHSVTMHSGMCKNPAHNVYHVREVQIDVYYSNN